MIIRSAGPGTAAVMVARSAAQDDRLSFRARGVLTAVLSRPTEWRTSAVQLSNEGQEGEHAIRRALRELEAYGYLVRQVRSGAGGRLCTEWLICDDPSLLANRTAVSAARSTAVRSTAARVTESRSTAARSTAVQLTAVQNPAALSSERERRRETPPPTPAAAVVEAPGTDALVVVVDRGIKGKARPPAARMVRAECSRLALAGWGPDQLEEAVRAHDWSGAGAGAVVVWLRSLQDPPTARQRRAAWPDWCGECDQASRRLLDDQGRPRRATQCPTCHPNQQGAATS